MAIGKYEWPYRDRSNDRNDHMDGPNGHGREPDGQSEGTTERTSERATDKMTERAADEYPETVKEEASAAETSVTGTIVKKTVVTEAVAAETAATEETAAETAAAETIVTGKIVKGIAGFYYVDAAESGIYECKAKGIFRKENRKPLVGDDVEIEILDKLEMTGNLIKIFPRKNRLIRPAAANVDQALVIFAVQQPDPNYVLLDRFLIAMQQQNLPVIICFNKQDLTAGEELRHMYEVYSRCGYQVLFTSAQTETGFDTLRKLLAGKTTVTAGPSGVGKSSITNRLQKEISMETGEISKKLKRGRHTTRHAQLLRIAADTYLMDTPGFSSLFLENLEKEELAGYFPEFGGYEKSCRFQGCAHIHEPDCGVKAAVEMGIISRERYANYVMFYEELKEREKRRY